jgi:hypothetical protein
MAKQPKISNVEQYEANKKAATQAREDELRSKQFFGVMLQGQLYDGLSGQDITFLKANNKSFVEAMNLIDGFQKMSAEDQVKFFSDSNEATRITLENDGYISSQIQTLAKSPDEAQELIESRRAAEQNRQFTEAREAEEANAQLYPGVEKVGNKFRLTLDPGDGTGTEVFWGDSQKEVFQQLAKSKIHATQALRKRAGQVKLTQELREMQVDVLDYAPLEVKVTLTPAELYEAHAMLADPSTAVEGTRRLQAAARTQEDVDRANEGLLRARFLESKAVAEKWMTDNPQFYPCNENIQAMMQITGGLNWAITPGNMTKAFLELAEQNALVERLPETDVEAPAFVQPKPRPVFVPRAAAPSPAVPVAPQPTVPLRRPTNGTSLNGGSTSSARLEKFGKVTVAPMTAAEYDAISSSDMKARYGKDANFKDRVDAYWQAGGR